MTMIPKLADLDPAAECVTDGRELPTGEQPHLYRELFEHMPEGFAYCQMVSAEGQDCDFVYLAVNAAFESLTGLNAVVGKRASQVMPGIRESDPELLRTYARVARTGAPEKFEIYVDALRMWFSISAFCPRKEFFVAIFDVITERKLAERALRESEASLHAVFDDAPLPYHEIDQNGIVRRANRVMCNMLGLDVSEMVGRAIWDFLVPEEREQSRASVREKLRTPGASAPLERRFLARNGDELVFQVHSRPILDEDGRAIGLRSALIDLTETKRLNASLAQERQLFGALMDQSPDHIYFKDAEGHFILVNTAMVRLLGCGDLSQVVGKSDFDFFSLEHAEPAHQDELTLVEGLVPVVNKEERETWPDRPDTWVHTTKLPLRDRSGAIVGTFGISRDITERRRMEQALRANQDRLKLTEEALSLGTWNLDVATDRASCSERLVQLYGGSGTSMDAARWHRCIHPDDRERAKADLTASLQTGKPLNRRFRVIWPDGSLHWLNSISSVVRDSASQSVHVVGIDFDITEQALAEERLHILSTAVEQCPSSIMITDLLGNIEYVNPRITELTGYSSEELIGQNPRFFNSGETPPREYQELWRAIQTGEWRGTLQNRKKSGELFWEDVVICPIRDQSGKPTHYLAVKEDITAQKLAKDKIAWLASFPEQDPNPVVEIEVPGGVVRYVNPAARDLLRDLEQQGMAHAWLAGLEEAATSSDLADGNELSRDVMVGDHCFAQTIHYLPRVQCLRVYGIDITKRMRAEGALRRSETKFRAIYDSTSDALMLLDSDGFSNCNKAALTMFGCATVEEFCSQNPNSMSPPLQPCGTDSLTLANRHIAEAIAKGSTRFEWIHKRIDTGETFPGDVLLNTMDLDGRKVLQAVVRDITKRKRAEEALRQSERKYRTLVRHIPEKIFHKDSDSVYVSCNDLFAQELGIAAADIAGTTDFDYYPGELAEKHRADDRRIMELRKTVELEEAYMVKGELRTVLTVKTPVTSEQGEVIGVLGVLTDITERKRAEEALRQSESQLRLAQKLESIGQLAAGIAHEINTPVQYIGDNAQFLSGAFQDLFHVISADESARDVDVDYLRTEIPNAIAQMQEGVDRVAMIVRAMKRFSHPGPAEKLPLDIHQAIESTVLVSRNEWKYVADLTTDFDPDMPPVPCVAGEFNQVILNLIVNAAHAIGDVVKGSGEKGAIRVRTRAQGGFAEIRVSDTGGGIPEAIRGKVFDPFFTTKPVGKGTGQGLAIAHSVIVRKHQGTIEFESKCGEGTTFVIRLPLIEGTETK